jgi:hypothetical protein
MAKSSRVPSPVCRESLPPETQRDLDTIRLEPSQMEELIRASKPKPDILILDKSDEAPSPPKRRWWSWLLG